MSNADLVSQSGCLYVGTSTIPVSVCTCGRHTYSTVHELPTSCRRPSMCVSLLSLFVRVCRSRSKLGRHAAQQMACLRSLPARAELGGGRNGRCGNRPSDGHDSAETETAEFGGCVTSLHSTTQKSGHNVECGDATGLRRLRHLRHPLCHSIHPLPATPAILGKPRHQLDQPSAPACAEWPLLTSPPILPKRFLNSACTTISTTS